LHQDRKTYAFDPLYGETPVEHLAMVLEAKAMVNGRRHLVREHGLEVIEVRRGTARELFNIHYRVHGFAQAPSVNAAALPWGIVSRVHTDQRDRDGGPSGPLTRRMTGRTWVQGGAVNDGC
jgi:hypothetical protein